MEVNGQVLANGSSLVVPALMESFGPLTAHLNYDLFSFLFHDHDYYFVIFTFGL